MRLVVKHESGTGFGTGLISGEVSMERTAKLLRNGRNQAA
jgi:hypothetical protein